MRAGRGPSPWRLLRRRTNRSLRFDARKCWICIWIPPQYFQSCFAHSASIGTQPLFCSYCCCITLWNIQAWTICREAIAPRARGAAREKPLRADGHVGKRPGMTCEILNRLRAKCSVGARGDRPLFGKARAYAKAMRQEKRRLGSDVDRKNAPDDLGPIIRYAAR
jgi:hypothetical protein